MRHNISMTLSRIFFSSFILFILSVGIVIFFTQTHETNNLFAANHKAVELGIAELSPAGESGGYAMPASGSSNKPTITMYWKQDGDPFYNIVNSGETISLSDDRAIDLGVDYYWNGQGAPSGEAKGGEFAYRSRCSWTGYMAPKNVNGAGDSGCPAGGSGGSAVTQGSGSSCTPKKRTATYIIQESEGAPDRLISAAGNNETYTVTCKTDYEVWMGNPDTGGYMPGGTKKKGPKSVTFVLSGPACSDGNDNDGDGLTDQDDPGCHTDEDPYDGDDTYNPDDDDEEDGIPAVVLEACDQTGRCENEELVISDSDEVTLQWESVNTDFCDPVGTFNMTGSPVQGSESNVEEPEPGSTKSYLVACAPTGSLNASVVDYVYVTTGGIQLIPYPNPPIVPGIGMPPSNPATVEPVYDGFTPDECTLTGWGIATSTVGTATLQQLTDDGRLVGGKYEVNLKDKGETTFSLECISGSASETDSASFRKLPVIEET